MRDNWKIITGILVLFAALALSACAKSGVRGQAPFVQINSLGLFEHTLTLDLGVRNVNSEPFSIEHIEFSIMVRDTGLAVYNAASNANLIANGSENLRFELAASPEGLALLTALQHGEIGSLEYELEGVFQLTENAKMKFRHTGHLFRVPGRPGQFR